MLGTLLDVSLRRTSGLILATVIAACLAGSLAMPAVAAPSAAQTAAQRAAVQRAIEQYEVALARATEIETRMAEVSAELDRVVAEENQARARLHLRASVMYRSGDSSFIRVLMGAQSFQDFAARLDLLARMVRQNAETLRTLKDTRAEIERSAEELIDLQTEEAHALDALADQVAHARKKLAASETARREYEKQMAEERARQASAQTPAPAPERDDPTQQLTGSGEWETAVASHYGRDFSGRGASGETIGPYSMMVAHKTLPFGTLIEFEYKGKRVVAKVADRGPYTAGRTFDLGPGVVRVLDFSGVHEVRYRVIK